MTGSTTRNMKNLPASIKASNYFAYLRVSTDEQENANQKLGLLEYANSKGFVPLQVMEDMASRKISWRKRALGALLEQAQQGDIILAAEVSRLAGSALQVLEFLEEAANKGVTVHITKNHIVMDGSLQATITATILGLAAQIEREFISARTREALQRRKIEGKPLGRPKGSQGALKMDKYLEEIRGYLALELSQIKIAKRVGCTPKTLGQFIKRRGLK